MQFSYITLKFTDNILFNGTGSDLVIHFADEGTEEVRVWVSRDGIMFLPVGTASSQTPDIDLGALSDATGIFPSVKHPSICLSVLPSNFSNR